MILLNYKNKPNKQRETKMTKTQAKQMELGIFNSLGFIGVCTFSSRNVSNNELVKKVQDMGILSKGTFEVELKETSEGARGIIYNKNTGSRILEFREEEI